MSSEPGVYIELLIRNALGSVTFQVGNSTIPNATPRTIFDAAAGLGNEAQVFAAAGLGFDFIELLVRKIQLLRLIGQAIDLSTRPDGDMFVQADTMRVTTDAATTRTMIDAPSIGVEYPEPDFRPLQIDTVRMNELVVRPSENAIIAILQPRPIDQVLTPGSGKIHVGNRNLFHGNSTNDFRFIGTMIRSQIAGAFNRRLSIRHGLAGSTSSFEIEGTFEESLDLSVNGAEDAENLVAVSVRDSEFLGGFSLDVDSPSTGSTTVIVGESGVYHGPFRDRNIDIASAGAETLVFHGQSNVMAAPGIILNTDIELANAPATILSASAFDTSTVHLFGVIGVLRPLEPPALELFERTFGLLSNPFSSIGQMPDFEVQPVREIRISGSGDVMGAAFDGDGMTTMTAAHSGTFDVTAGIGVELEIPGLEEIELPPGPIHLSTVTNTSDSGTGSLRAALESASMASAGTPALIRFAIPETDPNFRDVDSHLPGGDAAPDAFVISTLSALPVLVRDMVVINGASQTSYSGDSSDFGPEIVLAGLLAGPAANGLEIRSNANLVHGLNVQGFGRSGVFSAGDGNVVTGCFLGTDATGMPAPGTANVGSGVRVSSGAGNAIGGNAPGEGNVIAGNRGDGVLITAGSGHRVGNNVISSNLGSGVLVFGIGTSGNHVTGNLIGTDASGQIDRGNAIMGVWVINSAGNIVRENLVSGNDVNGLVFAGASASQNQVGTDGDGFDDALEGNRIANNAGAGVSVVGDMSRENTVRGNAISANGGLGIDLGPAGVNTNDTLDSDSGANDLQNHPVIENARNNGSTVQINGLLRSTPNSRFHVDFYANETPDASGYGEGRRWIGSIVVQTDATGFASYQFTGSPDLAIRNEWVSATATAQETGSTSEFSNARQVLGRPTLPPGQGRGESLSASTGGMFVLDKVAVDALLPNLDSESSRLRLFARSRRGRGMRN